jgi:hypothetical protein
MELPRVKQLCIIQFMSTASSDIGHQLKQFATYLTELATFMATQYTCFSTAADLINLIYSNLK